MSVDRIPVTRHMSVREQAIQGAAQALFDAVAERASRTPREAAEAAWYPGHPLGSVEAIEAEIIRRRTVEVGVNDRAA